MILRLLAFLSLLLYAIGGAFNKNNEYLLACERGETERALEFLDKGVLLETKNNNGVSGIIWASNNGHAKTVEALLDRGAPIEDRSNNGRTPLIWASLWGHLDVVKLLLNRGANINLFDLQGMTPLMSATLNGHVPVVEYLLDHGANASMVNFYGGSAISIARTKELREIELLLEIHVEQEPSSSPFVLLGQHMYHHFMKMCLAGLRKAQDYFGTEL